MSDQLTTENFFKIWQMAGEASTQAKEPEYRLYHDEQGFPLFYSMEECPGSYVVVSKETYTRSPKQVRVIEGKLKKYEYHIAKKLVPGTVGTCCDPTDICLVVDHTKPHIKWSLKQVDNSWYYDI